MRIAGALTGYELLDAGDGNRLENWNGFVFKRPDPQILWPAVDPTLWKPDAEYLRSKTGGGKWTFRRPIPDTLRVSFGPLRFLVRPTGFKHMGLFPEQAANWAFLMQAIKAAGRPISVLNLFAYTGGATLAALSAGASVCHVDASKGMVQWARDNASESGLADAPCRWIVDDCLKFVEREARRGHTYDAIILDPPSYGRGPDGQLWTLESSVYELCAKCAQILSDKPLLMMLNTYTTGLTGGVMAAVLSRAAGERFQKPAQADEIGLVAAAGGMVLPAGNTAILYHEE